MAIKSLNGPKPNAGEVKQIINFLKEMLPNYLVRAIEVMLKPCCDLGVTAEVVCNEDNPGNQDLIFHIANPIIYPGTILAIANSTVDGSLGQGVISDNGKVITFANQTLTPGDATFSLTIFLLITEPSTGLGISNSVDLTVPDCS